MPSPTPTLADRVPADPHDADALYAAFTGWAADQGLSLYPHQEESLLELVTGAHVIVSTPTGSGKSLIAAAAHFVAFAQGRRTYYTAPLKALVSEKFFALVEAFGSANVGMMTGDSAVNPTAPIICCTAEILANLALRDGDAADVGQVVMDEFHFYSDPQRGWAWQVPLLELQHAQLVLMSATLGDVSFFRDDLQRRTSTPVAVVADAERPVPLTFAYAIEPLHELLDELVRTRRAPVYVVHFTQKEAVERAQSLLSTPLASREQRDRIADELGAFRFGPGFGRTLSRLLRHGVGVHHAGMLPKYRRVVERLTQKGLLPVVCGTDTLGVGINVPIRTVLLTSLVKYDGVRMRHLTAREFHQIAGRAGRAGFDTVGEVIVLAPEHVIENRKLLEKAGDDPRKLKKIVRKKAPEGLVNWTDKTFERLRDAPPEPLTSSFSVSHAMVLHVLARPGDPIAAMTHLLMDNHEPESARGRHVRRAIAVYRSLRASGVVERPWVEDTTAPHGRRRTVRLTHDLPSNFALNQALSPFAYAALDLLDRDDPAYAHDVVSVLEATLDDPRQVLAAQENRARGEAVAAMKAEGLDYDQRMALLEDVTYPRPLAELLEAAFVTYRQTNPWVADLALSPKSVVREMHEKAMTFAEYVSVYQLDRTEGVLLRYLADAYRALRQTVPDERRTEELWELIEWLGDLVRRTDSSLLDEWERLANPLDEHGADAPGGTDEDTPEPITANPRVFRALVRGALFRRVEMAAREQYGALAALGDTDVDGVAWDNDRWAQALDPFYDDHDEILTGPAARGPGLFQVSTGTGTWRVRQLLDDPEGDHDWRIDVVVDLVASDEAGEVRLRVEAVGAL
ncbi:DEAD/DEAH box helicase [Cellulomonas soli]|uniref:DEAD/DEAH box helicase n=1 Tax=Cellulomonas soli TaxID=931535 RepID=A0A512PIJ0_9CELL|nr:DEAD/DEAH box helicase [Cellulomonas soli]NYI59984.1 superfamily II RNA helicase [Cellulomonas soli]GEP71007.1 DEAD/DEAH box helicase [Cellulomonas soli]